MPKMHGPGISNPDKIVERDVPENDVQAYVTAGYKLGGIPDAETAETPEELQEQVEAPKPKRSRKKKGE